jgi:hypothetical protein
MNFVNEERMGYFRSTARSPDEVEQENIVLQEQLDELTESMDVIENELAHVEWVFTDTLDVLKEPYVVAKNNLIQPYIERKMQFLQFKIEANQRFMQQKQGSGPLVTGGGAKSGPGGTAKPHPLSRKENLGAAPVSLQSLALSDAEAAVSSRSLMSPAAPARNTTGSSKTQSSSVKLQAWRQGVLPFAKECLDLMRQVLPVDVFSATDADTLRRMQNYQLSPELASRFMTKQCLWILCLNDSEIQTIDDSLLIGVYNTKGQNLDLVETAAVYGTIPEDFFSPLSSSAMRLDWADRIQRKLRHMLKEKEDGLLAEYRIRCPAYFALPAGPPASASGGKEEDESEKEEEEEEAPVIMSCVPFGGSAAKQPPPLLPKPTAAPTPRKQDHSASAALSGSKPAASPSGAAARVRRRSLFNTSRKGGPPTHVIRSSKVLTQPDLTPTPSIPPPPPPRVQTETIAVPVSQKKKKVLKHADI